MASPATSTLAPFSINCFAQSENTYVCYEKCTAKTKPEIYLHLVHRDILKTPGYLSCAPSTQHTIDSKLKYIEKTIILLWCSVPCHKINN